MRRLVTSPDAVGNLTFQNTEVPTPKANECLIRVKAFSMNRGELKRSQNDPLGTPIGWDIVGVVEQTARDGSGPPTGTEIVALSIRSEGWAEYVAISTRFLAIIPQSISHTDAATLPVAGLTALYAVEKGSRLRAWIPKPAFGSSNQPVRQCRSVLHFLSPQHLPILAREDDLLLSQTEFTGHSTLVGDWSEHCWDDLGGSESELDDGSHFRSVFAANICLRVCRNHCDYMASEF
ncbi:NADPH:qui reductase or related Zn-dependent oxidoreductase (plasmid) [Nostoc flagelliforme CCNUN1]|uniref:NADPH:qui reductase or related Zn-dependent oxidoreductase n=1 Tax=Nostoc flagelliforme CCNUN1 TaxID=2038116 RepID=A0A2K8TA16_9NOSO|nr:hypothetical protein [Nostoc flagelliforme]AUB44510.1 NADPH:qui reductase or related Zn-dependent oxidoreductase [Nostoc flagelliforme CCNUN1]